LPAYIGVLFDLDVGAGPWKMEECPAKHALVEERPRLLSLGKQQIK